MLNLKQYDLKRYNISLIITVILLSITSAFLIKFAGGSSMGNYFFKRQLVGLIGGLFIIALFSVIDYHFVCSLAAVYYIFSVILVAATKFSPLGTDLDTGSFRWLDFGVLNLQPSELAKVSLILTLSAFFTKFKDNINKLYVLVLAVLLMAVPTFFILTQSDLSSSMVMMFIFVMMVFAAGLSYKIIIPIISVLVPSFIGFIWYVQQPFAGKILKPYQIKRIVDFIHQEGAEGDTMYQQIHSVQAIASGRVYGKMLLSDASAREYRYVDVTESDFIFSVIGEELGFLGSCVIISLLAIVIIKCLLTARKAKDFTGQLIAIGIASMFMFQVFANVGVATSILPNTGLPLPFISYGLSSMLSSMIGIGIVLNIGIQTTKYRYS
jgi:rod shape determining protein RodA